MAQAVGTTKKAPRKAQASKPSPRKVPKAPRKRPVSSMSAEHKQALAIGREEGRAVRSYLEALESHKPKRGRKRTPDSIRRRLQQIDSDLLGADPLSRVHLIQEQIDLGAELESKSESIDLTALEDAFVNAASGYSLRKGITYSAWRQVGVNADVLRRARIARTRT
jgi:hypothetical protein